MRRFHDYKIERGDNLGDPGFWNRILEDLDVRIAAREGDATALTAAVDALEAVALQRLNDTFTPLIVDAQERLNSLGVSFSAESLTSATIAASGDIVLTLTEASAANYVWTEYVSIRAASAPTNRMLGLVTAFDRSTGNLSLTIVQGEGSGTYTDWLIRVGTPPETAGHSARTDNPHQTTAAQVGAYTEAETDTLIADAMAGLDLSFALVKALNLGDIPSVAAARGNLGLGALAIENTVGTGSFASNVRATQAAAEAGTDNVTLMTPLRVAQAIAVIGLALVSSEITAAQASAAELLAGTATKSPTAASILAALAPVALTDAAPIQVNLANLVTGTVTLSTSRTLANPTNHKVGRTIYFRVKQPAGGNCTLSYDTQYDFGQSTAPLLSTGANVEDLLAFYVASTSKIVYLGIRKDIG